MTRGERASCADQAGTMPDFPSAEVALLLRVQIWLLEKIAAGVPADFDAPLTFAAAAEWLGWPEELLRKNYEGMPGFKKYSAKNIVFHRRTFLERTFGK